MRLMVHARPVRLEETPADRLRLDSFPSCALFEHRLYCVPLSRFALHLNRAVQHVDICHRLLFVLLIVHLV